MGNCFRVSDRHDYSKIARLRKAKSLSPETLDVLEEFINDNLDCSGKEYKLKKYRLHRAEIKGYLNSCNIAEFKRATRYRPIAAKKREEFATIPELVELEDESCNTLDELINYKVDFVNENKENEQSTPQVVQDMKQFSVPHPHNTLAEIETPDKEELDAFIIHSFDVDKMDVELEDRSISEVESPIETSSEIRPMPTPLRFANQFTPGRRIESLFSRTGKPRSSEFVRDYITKKRKVNVQKGINNSH